MKKELKQIEKYENASNEEIHLFNNKIDKKIIKHIIINLSVFLIMSLLSLFQKNYNISIISDSLFYFLIVLLLFYSIAFIVVYKFTTNKEVDYLLLKYKKMLYIISDIISSVILALLIGSFISIYIITPAKVSGNSMELTFSNNDTLIAWQLFYTPKTDDVIVMNSTNYINDDSISFLLKRIVGTSDDKVEYIDGYLCVNNEQIQSMDVSTYNSMLTNHSTGITYPSIPNGYCIVLGDNRTNSSDSRSFGLVKTDDVIAKIIFRISPTFGVPVKEVFNCSNKSINSYKNILKNHHNQLTMS